MKGASGKFDTFTNYEVIVDGFTGVQYLYLRNTANGSVAVTPLLGQDGKPLVVAEAQDQHWFGQIGATD
ncbi:MAG: hypothetical protein IKR73_07300 [Oscillospiraceae bacterium]|nr:hypothetical protein [Oscillospiraceae bacterium]